MPWSRRRLTEMDQAVGDLGISLERGGRAAQQARPLRDWGGARGDGTMLHPPPPAAAFHDAVTSPPGGRTAERRRRDEAGAFPPRRKCPRVAGGRSAVGD